MAQLFRVAVNIRLKKGVLDPQGKAVKHGLESLGFSGVEEVRVGKRIELSVHAENKAKAEEAAKQMSERLLANPIMESFQIEVMA